MRTKREQRAVIKNLVCLELGGPLLEGVTRTLLRVSGSIATKGGPSPPAPGENFFLQAEKSTW